jgi:hypothetical protein
MLSEVSEKFPTPAGDFRSFPKSSRRRREIFGASRNRPDTGGRFSEYSERHIASQDIFRQFTKNFLPFIYFISYHLTCLTVLDFLLSYISYHLTCLTILRSYMSYHLTCLTILRSYENILFSSTVFPSSILMMRCA